jgi:succinoglycan biosynthesis transport protein ExoP
VTIRQFLAILAARRWLAITTLLLALGIGAAITLLLPKQYSSTASLVIDVKSPDPIAGMVYPAMMTPSYMATQVDIIENERVGLRVVRQLKMTESPQMRSQWQQDTGGAGNFEVWLAKLLLRNLDVKPARESNIIQISFSSVEPRFSAVVANAFAQAYIDTTLELRVEPAKLYSSFFDARARQARDEVERAQAKLSEFQRSKGILATDERLDIETARLNELSAQLVTMQAMSAEASSRQSAARNSPDQSADVINHPVVAGLRADVARQEARMKEIGERFGDAHPQVLEQRASLLELRAKLEQETARLSGSAKVSNTIAQSREAQIFASLQAQRARVLKLREQRDEIAVLQREVEYAQRAYDGVAARLNQTNLESQSTQTNAVILTPATDTARPTSPRPLLNMVIALFAGIFAAIVVALLREATDRRVRSLEDVSRDMGLPVLGSLLGAEPRNWLGRKRRHSIPSQVLGRASLRSPRLAGKAT